MSGVYVAGELAGLALVKNAIAQARKVVDRIAQKGGRRHPAGGGRASTCWWSGRVRRAARRRPRPRARAELRRARAGGGPRRHDLPLPAQEAGARPGGGGAPRAVCARPSTRRRNCSACSGACAEGAAPVRFGERSRPSGGRPGPFGGGPQTSRPLTRGRARARPAGHPAQARRAGRGAAQGHVPAPGGRVLPRQQDPGRGRRGQRGGGGDRARPMRVEPGGPLLSAREARADQDQERGAHRGPLRGAPSRSPCSARRSRRSARARSGCARPGAKRQELLNDFVFVFAGGDPPFELLRRSASASAATRPPARSLSAPP